MKQAIKADQAVALIPDGAVLMIGGFMAVGTPRRLIDEKTNLYPSPARALARAG
ncbi:MAG: CoA-transferase [Chromatiales bacterium]